ncbi:DUF3859 domain-containing protein [Yoonia sediminilitoris]|uniref:Uncharacterized protein DUF3859 n=1 Tax=Yoonia sediminilitoris TaxID=1286148 RepID=A0A2T6KH08_9RHOB|nr:DUF3859 domain-containing protein [Yoonia sediminilitoris]PUB14802.1 uncharacterized protein DUF3859 [Yoonia sediminilitoris]RCW95519.1 uncharacterized protein DUF3859 [Yoonia sediminilitoris]
MKPIIALLVCLPSVLLSETLSEDRISDQIASFEAGIICAPEPVGSTPAPGTVAGTTHVIDVDPPFVSTNRRVPAVIGIGFGVKAMARDPAGLQGVTILVTHPPMGKDRVEEQNFGSKISGSAPSVTFYQFDAPYERVYGTWNMTAIKNGEQIYSADFEVVPASQVLELASVCGFEALLS